MNARIWLSLILAIAALPARASEACYSPQQLKAEQLLRLHSELMVVTVTCRQGSHGEDLPAAYGDFTKRNIGPLHDAEQTMMGYYKVHKKGRPVDNLDRLRTILGNEYGQKAADMSSPVFCAAYRDKVVLFENASPSDVRDEVQRMTVAEHSFVRPCGVKPVLAKVK